MAKSDLQLWEEQAKFLRDVGAIHGEWTGQHDEQRLVKLVLGPPPPKPGTTPAPEPAAKGIAAKLFAQHETLFAASRHKPPFKPPADAETAVPRAVRAKREAAAHGAKKAQKRGT